MVPGDARRAAADAAAAAHSLDRHGYAVVADLLTPADLEEAESLIDGLLGEFEALVAQRRAGQRSFAHDMASTGRGGADQPELLYAASLEPRLVETGLFRKCAELAAAIVGGPVSRSFDHVIVKSAWNDSVTPWHQDAALTRFGAMPEQFHGNRLHFWVPLQDATLENGCMEFVAGSHRKPLLAHESYARRDGSQALAAAPRDLAARVACPVAAGGCTIHTPRTLHHTGRNATPRSRKAWIIHFSRFGRAEIALKRAFGRVPSALR